MTLPTPKLDNRTFKELVDEARDRIPRYTPEWTNFNDSDPGMTMVKLHAWLTETLLYQLNQLPDVNHLKFLELLHVSREPARAASTELSFSLKKLSGPADPLKVLIPRQSQVGVDDPELEQPLIFETDYTLTALNAALGAVLIPNTAPESAPNPYQLITEYDTKQATTTFLHAFHPFGPKPGSGNRCLIGLVPRPHRNPKEDYSLDSFPAGQLDLTVFATGVFDRDADGEIIQGPRGERCLLPHEATRAGQRIDWSAFTGTEAGNLLAAPVAADWQTLDVGDDTAGLTNSGHIRLEIPEGLPAYSLDQLPRSLWEALGLHKYPTTLEQLKDDLRDSALTLDTSALSDDDWMAMGVPEAELNDVKSCCESVNGIIEKLDDLDDSVGLTVGNVPGSSWLALDAGYDTPPVPPYPMIWLKAELNEEPTRNDLINELALNTVPATAAVTRLAERLGFGNGRPAQQFQLARTPVYFDPDTRAPDLVLEVEESGTRREWRRVDDFYGTDAASEVFVLDPIEGTVSFGDGKHGRIPIAGAEIIARRYRYGGGAIGNVGPGSITKLKSPLPRVDKVSNRVKAANGEDAEPLEDTRLRASQSLKTRDRAVTAEDFSELARQTRGVAIQRAYALPRYRLDASGQLEADADGAVSVVILPVTDHPTPQPSEAQLRAVCAHLNTCRLVTTELYVTGPEYTRVATLKATIEAGADADLKAVQENARQRLLEYFHPLRGGNDGRGWPFGEDILYGHVYQQLLTLPGVGRVMDLYLQLDNEAASDAGCRDRIEIAPGNLVHLPADVIQLSVRYQHQGAS
ncbi:putative baseplate assembly protein [Marinobacter lacisalsi]|uniref:Baseplate assembly protein n=1 Tax=Marinobacter lacisalsi TaxID=475979 RepID=A0ABV8QKX5_9GAMM